jgi:hypothetical protein
MTGNRVPKINSHVARLNRFLPFSTAHDQIYEEYQTGIDGLNLGTIALAYAERALKSGAGCIVLTGDAGHGKTHMCRRLIETVLGYDGNEARRLLVTKCDGASAIPSAPGKLNINVRIHKDFSELEPKAAANLLEGVSSHAGETLVVCANEGRLRAIVNSAGAGKVCEAIRNTFQRSFETGQSSLDGKIHIVNLNYQSVAARADGSQGSLIQRTIRNWAADRRRWGERGCGSCSVADRCPIRRNRSLLADDGEISDRRVARLEDLFEAVERLGHVVTIREMLMLISYLITGGLRCEDVHTQDLVRAEAVGWQHAWAFYNLLFQAPPKSAEDRIYKGIPVLEVFRRLDPGAIASRAVDEKILNIGGVFPEGELDLQFLVPTLGKSNSVDAALGLDDFLGNPQSRSELARESETTLSAVWALRRRAFFDDNDSEGTVMSRLGFRHGDSFLRMLDDRLSPKELVQLKNMIVTGLHAMQGLRMSRTETTLHLVDPAFGRASDDAAIIARRIPTNQLNLLPARRVWNTGIGDWALPSSVDWIDRAVVLRVLEQDGQTTDIALDLLAFECVTRSAAGYVPEEFYSREIRRIRAFLGRLAAFARTDGGEISLFMEGRVQNVSIDMNVIQVGGD